MVKIGATSISNLAVGNKNIDLLNIGNKIIYAGYPYPCVGEYNLTPHYSSAIHRVALFWRP